MSWRTKLYFFPCLGIVTILVTVYFWRSEITYLINFTDRTEWGFRPFLWIREKHGALRGAQDVEKNQTVAIFLYQIPIDLLFPGLVHFFRFVFYLLCPRKFRSDSHSSRVTRRVYNTQQPFVRVALLLLFFSERLNLGAFCSLLTCLTFY